MICITDHTVYIMSTVFILLYSNSKKAMAMYCRWNTTKSMYEGGIIEKKNLTSKDFFYL